MKEDGLERRAELGDPRKIPGGQKISTSACAVFSALYRAAMVQRYTYRRRHSYATASNKVKLYRRTLANVRACAICQRHVLLCFHDAARFAPPLFSSYARACKQALRIETEIALNYRERLALSADFHLFAGLRPPVASSLFTI